MGRPKGSWRNGYEGTARKVIYSFLALAGVGLVILLGRIYLKVPEERPVTRIPLPRPPSALVPEPDQKIGATKSIPALPDSLAADDRTNRAEVPSEGTAEAKPGDSLYTIAARTYKVANTSIVDRILESNPGVAGPNKVLAKQKIRLPRITEESLIIESPGGSCKVRLGTFLKPEYSAFLKGEPSLMGRKIEITPRRLSSGETWYRVVAGGFPSREEALRTIRTLKAKGLSPYFAGFKKK